MMERGEMQKAWGWEEQTVPGGQQRASGPDVECAHRARHGLAWVGGGVFCTVWRLV